MTSIALKQTITSSNLLQFQLAMRTSLLTWLQHAHLNIVRSFKLQLHSIVSKFDAGTTSHLISTIRNSQTVIAYQNTRWNENMKGI